MSVLLRVIKYETTAFLIKNISSDIKPSLQTVFRTHLEYISFLDAHQSYLSRSLPFNLKSDSMNLKAEPKTFQIKKKKQKDNLVILICSQY